MRIFGFEIARRKKNIPASWSSPSSRGWRSVIRESFSGAWQRNIELSTSDVLTFYAVYSCVTLIASDIAKLRVKLTKTDDEGISKEIESSAFSPVLRDPNHFQTRICFIEQWMTSKLVHGNTYVLKQRDQRSIVVAMYVLDPERCHPLVTPDGDVYYALSQDALTQVKSTDVVVPASEIIHDVMVPLYHPLCGVSPLSACGLPATQGLRIQRNSTNFFTNGSQPGGILTAPGVISEEDATEIRRHWAEEYTGDNAGKVAVLGNGLKYEAMTVNATDSQLIEQLKLTAEQVCSAYHVPAYMVGVAPPPAYNNVEALDLQYYKQCLQIHIEKIEALLNRGLKLPNDMGTEFELDDLLRMDSGSRVTAAKESANGGGMTFNEVRKKYHGLGPVPGGDVVLSQQQNYSLEALAKRDAQEDPFASKTPALPAAPMPAEPMMAGPESKALTTEDADRALVAAWRLVA
jgi:HK97 family phage portal protein